MMPNSAERQARALEGIKSYMGDLIRIMTAVNQSLVEFAKIVKENEEPARQSFNKMDPRSLWNHDATPIQKEGESTKVDPCPGCGLMYCEISDCGTQKKEGE